ncbi:hypothetical protein SAMN06296241_1367 [Salinimicrobium sediminis]|uniref:Uncharacterized protein n=1 Tax=Salinimicrobium sediminis TaxID=1343891 RepID=A0A285X388_9FLAO|nr:hypothetical protein [Salinimicrobium sediminis]SOC79830.1 hypothetical protein SAMN06296241_1367 [Salinimicrobium sediminis]
MITITNQPQNPPFNAYNNSIIEFGVDAGVPTVATISTGGHTFEIFPNTSGVFFFDFKSIIKALINGDLFNDSLVATSAAFFFNDSKLFYELTADIEVTLEDGTSQTTQVVYPFLKSAAQVGKQKFNPSDLKLLTSGATEVAHLTYFEGYPFDIAIYSDISRAVTISNVRTGISSSYNFSKGVNRLFVSNGENDNGGFENDIPLHLGVNELEFRIGTQIKFTLFLDKREAECGKLLKWLNPSGGWSYWNFMELHLDNIKTDTLERLTGNYKNISQSTGNISITGKQAEKELELMSGLVNNEERELLDTLLYSPKVYLYTNDLYQPFETLDFIEVELGSGTFSKSSKNKLTSLQVSVILPTLNTQTL